MKRNRPPMPAADRVTKGGYGDGYGDRQHGRAESDGPSSRAQGLRTRQQRLGILANPNRPPKPPLRRARLTGKWFTMRSGRRPSHADWANDNDTASVRADETAAAGRTGMAKPLTAGDDAPPLDRRAVSACSDHPDGAASRARAAGGHVEQSGRTRIDIDRLAASVEQTGTKTAARKPYGIAPSVDTDDAPTQTGAGKGTRQGGRTGVAATDAGHNGATPLATVSAHPDDTALLPQTLPGEAIQDTASGSIRPVEPAARAGNSGRRRILLVLLMLVLAVAAGITALLASPPPAG